MVLRLSTSLSSRLPSSDAGPAGKTRGVLAPAVRLLLALLGALAGCQIAEILRESLYAPHFGQPGKVLRLVAFTAVGFAPGYALGVLPAGAVLVGSRVKAEVTSVLQSPSGKMIFSRAVT
jgi:hypothetical protein